jgi:hypothetical protein
MVRMARVQPGLDDFLNPQWVLREKKWLSDLDSNQDKVLQRDLCYHYTIGQRRRKLAAFQGACKEKFPLEAAPFR